MALLFISFRIFGIYARSFEIEIIYDEGNFSKVRMLHFNPLTDTVTA